MSDTPAVSGASSGSIAPVIASVIERALSRLGDALPGVRIQADELAAFVTAHPRGVEAAHAAAGDDLEPLVELSLACALRRRDRAALELFERRYLDDLERTLTRVRLDPGEIDEVKQRVREKLLVASAGNAPRLEEYVGLGRLGGLLQVMATREALSFARRQARERPAGDGPLVERPAEDWDVGIELGRAEYREAFREAFAAAVASLPPRDRNLLRMHLLGGVTLEQLASVYSVHRATVVRWLASAREKLLEETRRGVKERLALRSDELDSMMASAQGRLDVSVERYFETRDPGRGPGG